MRYITDTSGIDLEKFLPKKGMTKAKANLLINTYGNANSEDLVTFFNNNLTGKSFCYKKAKKIFFNAKIEPITFWIDPNVKANFNKFGIAANIDPNILFEQIFSLYENVLGTDGPSDFLNKIDNIYTRQDEDLKDKIPVWEKILKTDNFQDTITKIDGILKGRIKYDENTRSFDSDYFDD